MLKSFRCPSCAAPLEIEGLYPAIDKCEFCGGSILLSSEMNQADETGSDDLLLQARKLKEIKQLALSGNKIHAIKIYRETFGAGLKAAKDAIDNMVEGKPVVFTEISGFATQNYNSTGIGEMSGQDLKLAEIRNELQRGNKINAIKIYREIFNVGLKEAKDAIDNMTEGTPVNFTNIPAFTAQNYNSTNIGQTETPALKLAEIQDEIRRGNKINAIKIYQKNFNVGLKEAKEAVEQIERDSFSTGAGVGQFNNQSVFGKTDPSGLSVTSIILGAIAIIILILIIIYALAKR